MANRVQILRSATALNRPAVNSRQPGELYVNWPDKQLGVIDSTQTPEDLIAVRFFSATTSYVAGDYVKQGTQLYQATAAVPAGAFNASQWTKVTLASDPGLYLPLTGGTLTGPGNLTVNGTASFGSTMTVTGVTTVNNSVSSKGINAALAVNDRGNSGGTVANAFQMYRDANVGRLWMTEAGDVLSFATTGAATFGHALTCSAGLTVNGAVATFNAGATAYNPGGYSLNVSCAAGNHAVGVYSVAGQRQWLCGEFNDGTFHIYDNSGGDRLSIDNSGAFILTGPPSISLNGPVYINANVPLQMTVPNGQNCITYGTVSGVRQWYWGVVAAGTFNITDNSAGRNALSFDLSGSNAFFGGGIYFQGSWGANQAWANSQFVTATRLVYVGDQQTSAGAGGITEPYGGSVMSGWAGTTITWFRFRQLQYCINGGWYASGYA